MIWLSGNISSFTGYDNLNYELLSHLTNLDVKIHHNSRFAFDISINPTWMQKARSTFPYGKQLLVVPPCYLDGQHISKKTAIFTMWESEYLEPEWVKELNKSVVIIVPCSWCKEVFIKNGVTVEIVVVPLGYDDSVYFSSVPPFAEHHDKTFRIGVAGNSRCGGIRKNLQRCIDLFLTAFPNEDIKLSVKANPDSGLECGDSRVEIINQFLAFHDLRAWYQSLTCFLSLSNSEGFGLHNLEAMACGRCIVSAKYSGVAEYLTEENGVCMPYTMVTAYGNHYSGSWSHVEDSVVVETLRSLRHEDLVAKGQRSAADVQHLTWRNMAEKVKDILVTHGLV